MKSSKNYTKFEGLNYKHLSNKYLTMNRVSQDNNKIVVKFASDHLLKTKYGYALILNRTHVVFLKEWQVNISYYGIEVLLERETFNVKEWGEFSDFDDTTDLLSFDNLVEIAKQQDNTYDENGFKINKVNWRF